MLNIEDTNPGDWRYVSEGGATIVFSYTGPTNPNFDGTVLRLRKALVPSLRREKKADSGSTQVGTELDEEPDDPTIEYQTRCMTRVIPQEHLPRLDSVHLQRSWLEELAQLQDKKRPEVRRDKDGIDVDRKKGVLATDLVGGNWLAVEIKPKWAFLPAPTHLSAGTKPIKQQTCRFCMHNHLRNLKEDQIKIDYCPLDLFSGDEGRIRIAVAALWKTWFESKGTVNNLKIFAQGKPVLPHNANLMLSEDAERVALEQIREAFTESLVGTLVKIPVLGILADLQRKLDTLDIEGLSQLWRHTEESAPLYRTTFATFFEQASALGTTAPPPTTPLGVSSLFLSSPEPDIPAWADFLDTFLSPFSAQLDHANPSPKDLRYYLLAYLLSATFKDCSVIVRLDFLRPGSEFEFKRERNTVTVIDLDPKSMDKLRGWEKLDKEIVTSYGKNNAQRKTCVDARARLN